jgi:hypothetical protein
MLSIFVNATVCDNLALTSNTYSETDDLISVIQGEYGSNFTIADWNDLLAISNLNTWASCMGLAEDVLFMVTKDGNYIYSGSRQYFVRYSTDGVEGSFLIHAQSGNFYLGSWYGLNQKILAKNATASIIFENEKSKINIYPNPANETIIIDGLQAGKIDIINLQGQVIKKLDVSNEKTSIDISKLSGGVYTMKIKTNDGIIVKKLIKQ